MTADPLARATEIARGAGVIPPGNSPPADSGTAPGAADLTKIAAAYTPVNWHAAWKTQPGDVEWLIEPFLEAGTVNALFGKPGTGKSLLTLEIALRLVRRAGHVIVYVDQENRITDLVERLQAFGAEPGELDRLRAYCFAGLPPLDTPGGGSPPGPRRHRRRSPRRPRHHLTDGAGQRERRGHLPRAIPDSLIPLKARGSPSSGSTTQAKTKPADSAAPPPKKATSTPSGASRKSRPATFRLERRRAATVTANRPSNCTADSSRSATNGLSAAVPENSLSGQLERLGIPPKLAVPLSARPSKPQASKYQTPSSQPHIRLPQKLSRTVCGQPGQQCRAVRLSVRTT